MSAHEIMQHPVFFPFFPKICVASFYIPGSIIIGGDDFPDHGSYNLSSSRMTRGWKFVLQAAKLAGRDSSLAGAKRGELAILGAYETANLDTHIQVCLDVSFSVLLFRESCQRACFWILWDWLLCVPRLRQFFLHTIYHQCHGLCCLSWLAGTAYHYVCATEATLTCKFINGKANMKTYLDDIRDGEEKPSALVIGGDDAVHLSFFNPSFRFVLYTLYNHNLSKICEV